MANIFTGIGPLISAATDATADGNWPAFSGGGFGGYAAIVTGPMGTVVTGVGAVVSLSAPAYSLLAAGSPSIQTTLAATAPQGQLSAFTGLANKSLAPTGQLSASGTSTVLSKANLTAPTGALDSSGSVAQNGRAILSAPQLASLIGYAGDVLSVTTPMGTLTASGTSGSTSSVIATLPMAVLVASGTANGHAEAVLTAPLLVATPNSKAFVLAPMATLKAIGTAVVAVTYEAYALNIKHETPPGATPVDEMTRYTNFPFNQIVRYQGSYFGVAADGLYLLGGTTDYAAVTPTLVSYAFKTAMEDDNTPNLKTVLSAYFSGRVGPATTVSLYPGEPNAKPYTYTTSRDATPQSYRQKFGRGIKERYYALGMAGSGVLELDTIEPEVMKLTRKI